MNPLLNAETLKQRLQVIEHYKMQHGLQYARWPHFFLGNVGRQLYKYKFNYGVKAFAAYLLYRDVQNARYWNDTVILSYQNIMQMGGDIGMKGAVLVALCAFL